MVRIASCTMLVSSSRITMPPDPAIVFSFAMESKSIGVSHSEAFSTGEEEPPGMTAFNFFPLRMPPQTSSIIRIRLNPSGSS